MRCAATIAMGASVLGQPLGDISLWAHEFLRVVLCIGSVPSATRSEPTLTSATIHRSLALSWRLCQKASQDGVMQSPDL